MKISSGKRKTSVKFRLVVYLTVFVVLIIGLLFVLQTFFLDDCYELMQRRAIVSFGDRLAKYIDMKDKESMQALLEYGSRNKIFVRIMNADGSDILPGDDDKLLSLSYYDIVALIARANDSDGSAFETYTRGKLSMPIGDDGGIGGFEVYALECMIYVKLVPLTSGETAAIIINSELTPLTSTIDTLRFQLLIVALVILLMAVVLGLLISRGISRPLVLVNREAKKLSRGQYEPPLAGDEYREISELNETLINAGVELAQTEEMRRELIANVSHDLRTPLTLIAGYAEMMRDIPGENNDENAQLIMDETTRLTSLVNDLLDVSKYRDGVQTLDIARYSVTESVREILERFSVLDATELDMEFSSDGDIFVRADRKRMEQVLYNLISNAVQYTRDGYVRVRQIEDGGIVRIEIEDRGEGIPESSLPFIWDRYYKVDRSHARSRAGSGLGLSIVRNILELHAMKYGVRSVIGEGSTFWFEMPIDKS